MRVSDKKVADFIKDAEVAEFFMNLENVLTAYPPGEPEMKPDVVKETQILLKRKEELKKNHQHKQEEQQELKKKQYDKIAETNPEIFQRIQSQQQQIHTLQDENQVLQNQLRQLKELYAKTIRENMELKKK
jgi:multidrug resistance efflux pump